jgi:RNA recognition motif-containing protein
MQDNSYRLFVGNLPFRMSREELIELFAQAGGVVSAHIPTDRETGRPRGFGFVEMESSAGMQQAIQMFNGYSVSGRALVVNAARPREDRAPSGGAGPRGMR